MNLGVGRAVGLLWSLGIPLLWILGVEQIGWVFLTGGLLLLFIIYGKVRIPLGAKPIVAGWLFFLLAILLAGNQIRDMVRFVSLARDFSVYASTLITFLLCLSAARDPGFPQRLVWHLCVFAVVMNVAVLSYVIGGPWRITSVLGGALPSSLAATTTGARMVTKAVAGELYFLGLTNVRARGFFSSGIHYGSIFLMVLPVFIWMVRHSNRSRLLPWGALLISVACFPFSQSRTAIATLILLPFLYRVANGFLDGRTKAILRLAVGSLALLASAVLLIVFVMPGIVDFVVAMFVEVRAGSFIARTDVYRLTLQGLIERPFTGWGTQRDVPGLRYPVGSHNWPLGIAYKYGLFGLLPAALTLVLILKQVFGRVRREVETEAAISFRRSVGAGALAYLLIALTLEPIVDAIAIHTFVALVGASVGSRMWAIQTLQHIAAVDPSGEPIRG